MKPIKQFLLLFTLLFFLYTKEVISQSLKSIVDKDQITIGDQIKITLTLDDINPKMVQVAKWGDFFDTSNHFNLVEKSSVDTLLFNGIYHFRQSFIVTSFDSGVYNIPSFVVRLINISTGQENELYGNSIPITISSVDVSKLNSYNDVTGIIPVTNNVEKHNNYFIVIIVLLLLISGVFFWKMKRSRKLKMLKNNTDTSLIDFTQYQLNELENEQKVSDISTKVFYDKLYHIIRGFYSKKFNEPAVINCTTTEWIFLTDKLKMGNEQKEKFISLLNKADEIRFTQIISIEEYTDSVSIARRIIEYFNLINS